MEIPSSVGVMVLPGAALFPSALLPLYIFEPRYRKMLARALAADRMFAVAMASAQGSVISPVGGVGLIRACVTNPDGTSHLILQGVARVRFQEWIPGEDYRQAHCEVLESRVSSESRADDLRKEIKHLCVTLAEGDMPQYFVEALEKAGGAGEFSDMVSAALVADPMVKQQLLEELEVSHRLEMLAAYIIDRRQE